MKYWLVKFELLVWFWDQQVVKGVKGEVWIGVCNYIVCQNLVVMKKGDKVFYYYFNEGKEIVGIVEIIKEVYFDLIDEFGKFVCVDIKVDKLLKMLVMMVVIKVEVKLKDMVLVKYLCLLVQLVMVEEWKFVCKMGGVQVFNVFVGLVKCSLFMFFVLSE